MCVFICLCDTLTLFLPFDLLFWCLICLSHSSSALLSLSVLFSPLRSCDCVVPFDSQDETVLEDSHRNVLYKRLGSLKDVHYSELPVVTYYPHLQLSILSLFLECLTASSTATCIFKSVDKILTRANNMWHQIHCME